MNIAIFGDSLVAGWSPDAPKLIKKNQTWPYLLKSSIPNSQVFVDGQPGRMLSNPLQPKADLNHFKDFIEKSTLKNCTLLILMIGANDLPVKSAPEILNELNEYLKTFQGNKIFVLHPGIQYEKLPEMFSQFKNVQKVEAEFKQLKNEINAKIVELDSCIIGADGLHIGADGQKEIAKKVKEVMQEMKII
ncbi:GDSL-like_Lipase/Acylhydrolase family protein [Hexamita inflata]|uniref:GDSL-like Lipase/Acylhydrolase family protein n=1 Tax=Hexamita inflata TaxID=28002 RepID=A0AA86TZ44_9EUKA|nr:GDSL-like Lipase/Acylhydrolase family protein [Hexamita inflata]